METKYIRLSFAELAERDKIALTWHFNSFGAKIQTTFVVSSAFLF